jgi:transposase
MQQELSDEAFGVDRGRAVEPIDKKRRRWAKRGLYLYYLPPYSPELNRIEILWKHAKHFWHRFVAKNRADLLDEQLREQIHYKFWMTT